MPRTKKVTKFKLTFLLFLKPQYNISISAAIEWHLLDMKALQLIITKLEFKLVTYMKKTTAFLETSIYIMRLYKESISEKSHQSLHQLFGCTGILYFSCECNETNKIYVSIRVLININQNYINKRKFQVDDFELED